MANERRQIPASVPRAARLAVAVNFFLTGVAFASWAVWIPAVQARLGLSPGELGVALLGTAAGELVSMNLAGYLAARFGSQSLTVIVSVCLSVMLPILALAPTLPILVAALLLFGTSFGSVSVAMNTQAGFLATQHVCTSRQRHSPLLLITSIDRCSLFLRPEMGTELVPAD